MAPYRNDLSELALERSSPERKRRGRRKPWVTRYLVPGIVIAGFLTLLGVAARDQVLARQPVTVVPVVVTRAEVQQEGTPLFQAAGWVEPRPTPINIPALTEGVVKELLVVEGQDIEAGMPIARLIDVDARLALRQAATQFKLREAELQSVKAELNAAQLTLKNPVHLQAELADAQSSLAQTQTALFKIPFLVQSAEAEMRYAQANVEGKRSARKAIAGILLEKAESDFSTAQSKLDELRQREPQLKREVEAFQAKVTALTSQLNLLIDESRRVAEAEARVSAAQARLIEAEIAVESAQLALDRTIVRAPRAGRVLNLIAHPGTRVMGMESSAAQSSSTVVSCYDPKMLQIRADVRLEDVPLVQPGQPVEIETASSKEPILGMVLLATSSADIQKNTLEVKVAITDPPPAIRPNMLVTATFLAAPQKASEKVRNQDYDRLLVPRQLVQSAEGGHAVWIVTPDGRAERRIIKLGKAGSEDLVEVSEGLLPTDKLISSGHGNLSPGARIVIAEEDPNIGLSRQS